jgi:DNA-binding XRE family transcriptional regulator
MPHQFDCYLRKFRRSWALSQRELAFIFGVTRQHVINIERAKSPPSLRILITSQVLFDVHLKEPFPKLWDEVEEDAVRRLYILQKKFNADGSRTALRKSQLIEATLQRVAKS